MRIAIYARVSKDDGTQTPENQVLPLRDYSKALGGEVVKEYVDMASGSRSDRAQFNTMLNDADLRKFDLLLLWSFDRFSREGIFNSLGYIKRIRKNGIGIKSLKEPMYDFSDEGMGELMLSFAAFMAAQERRRIVERTKAGLSRAKKNGKKLGRPAGKTDSKPRRKSGYLLRWQKTK